MTALCDSEIMKKIQDILRPSCNEIGDTIATRTIQVLKEELKKRDDIIANQKSTINALQDKMDEMEQWGSMRVQGLSETGPGTLENKLLTLFNEDLEIQPPIQLKEIEVAHRLPKRRGPPNKEPTPPAAQTESADVQPETVIIKFLSRRTKSVVMVKEVKKSLKDLDKTKYPLPVYFHDDLTARRAKLAFEERQMKRSGLINDTWVSNSKIIIKDLHNHIHAVTNPSGMNKIQQ